MKLYMSSELTDRDLTDSTELADDTVGRLSVLLSRPDELADDRALACCLCEGSVGNSLDSGDSDCMPCVTVTPLSMIVARRPSSTYNSFSASAGECKVLSVCKSRMFLTNPRSSTLISSSFCEFAGSKKCMTPFPLRTAKA